MILGHGVDIVDLRRFRSMDENRLLRLARRICTEPELDEFMNHKASFQYLAKIWAAKEAISKAFGTGIQGSVTWKVIQINTGRLGRPEVWFEKNWNVSCHLSISHEADYLLASAILETYA